MKDADIVNLIQKVDVMTDQLVITIHSNTDADPRIIAAPFTMRRRGAEIKMVLQAGTSNLADQTLAKRILRAMSWFDRIRGGEALVDIAADENISAEYITHNLDLAFLSPRFLTAVIDGNQPPELTTTALTAMQIPADWVAQEGLLMQGV